MPVRSYLRFAAQHRSLVAFGFLMAFASSFGQTFFIGIFGPDIQAELGLSHTAWGGVYLLGTLASAALLPFTGRLIDRVPLRAFAFGACALGVAACASMAAAAGAASLVLAVFLLRHSGQGLLSHTAITTMARYFDEGRGRAIALSTLGFSIGETVLPIAAVLVIALVGWRQTYLLAAVVMGAVLLPAALALLAGHGARHRAHVERLASAPRIRDARDWTRAEMLADSRFHLLLPGVLAPSVVITALFFHHLGLADAKGWSHELMTGSYAVYAAASVGASLAAGGLVDRHGARPLVTVMLLPMAAALVSVALLDGIWTVWLYLGLLGVNAGIAHTAVASLWAELYGVTHLGAIKSLAAALSVLGSALGPVTFGALLDREVGFETVCLLFAAISLGCTLLTMLAFTVRATRGRTVRSSA